MKELWRKVVRDFEDGEGVALEIKVDLSEANVISAISSVEELAVARHKIVDPLLHIFKLKAISRWPYAQFAVPVP